MARALTALSIGPLLPDGRSGLLADLKTYSALGLHGTAVATEVAGADVPALAVAAQINAVMDSIQVDAVKMSCPLEPAVLDAIAGSLTRISSLRLIVEPGSAALREETGALVMERLLPLALVTVLDQPEASALTGLPVASWDDSREAARAVAAMGAGSVVIKGDKLDVAGRVTDLLFDGRDYRDYTAERVELAGIVGAGTTFAAAIAATLAKDETVEHAVAAAKAYVTRALQSAYDTGTLPALHHFYRYWRPSR